MTPKDLAFSQIHDLKCIRTIEPNGKDAVIEVVVTIDRGVKPERETFAVRGPRRKSRNLSDPAQLGPVYADRVQDVRIIGVCWPFFVHGERQALTVRRPHGRVQAHPFCVGNDLHVGSVRGHREYPRIRWFVAATPRIGVALRIVVRDERDSGPVGRPDRIVLETCTSRQTLPPRAVRVRRRDLIPAARSGVVCVLAGGVHDSRAVGRDVGVASIQHGPRIVFGLRVQVNDLPHPFVSRVDLPDRVADVNDQRGSAVRPVKEPAMGDFPYARPTRLRPEEAPRRGGRGRHGGGGRGHRSHTDRRWGRRDRRRAGRRRRSPDRRGTPPSRPFGLAGLSRARGGRRSDPGRVLGGLALTACRPRDG